MITGDLAAPGMKDEGATTLVQATPIAMVITTLNTSWRRRDVTPGRKQRSYAGWSSLSKRAEGRPSIHGTIQQSKFADSSLPESAHIAEATIMGYLFKEARLQMSLGI